MPPEARLHEHHVALDGGTDGLELHRRVASGAPGWLTSGGSLLIETSPRQAADTAHFCIEAGLDVQILGDDPVRVVRAISSGSAIVWHNGALSRTPSGPSHPDCERPPGFTAPGPTGKRWAQPLHTRKETPQTWPSRFV